MLTLQNDLLAGLELVWQRGSWILGFQRVFAPGIGTLNAIIF